MTAAQGRHALPGEPATPEPEAPALALPEHDRWRSWLDVAAVLVPVAGFLVCYSFYHPNAPLLDTDSVTYLKFARVRTGGYPFFLSVFKPFIRDVADYTIVQRLFYALAVAALGWQVLRTFASAWLAFLATTVALGNPTVNHFHFQILTESLFLSVSALFFAAVLAHLRGGGAVSLATAAVFAACAATVRPTGLVFLPLVFVLLASAPHPSRRVAAKRALVALAAILLVFACEYIYYRAYHPGARAGFARQYVLVLGAMVEIGERQTVLAEGTPEQQALQRAIEVSLAPVRALAANAPSEAARCRIEFYYEAVLQKFAHDEKRAVLRHGGEKALITVGLLRLRHGFGGYLRLAADQLYCLWTFDKIDGDEVEAAAAYLDRGPRLPLDGDLRSYVVGAKSSPLLIGLLRGAMAAVAMLFLATSLALMICLARRRQPSALLTLAGLSGMATHGALLMTALAAGGISRYVFGAWIPLSLGVGSAALWLATLTLPAVSPWLKRRAPSLSPAA